MRVRYWVKTGLQSLGMLLLASLLYFLFVSIQMGELWEGLLTILPVYLLFFGAMMQLGMNLGLYRMNVPLALSFGSTRREIQAGLHLNRLIPTLGITVVLSVLTASAGPDGFLALPILIPLSLGLFLGASAIGSIMGLMYTKWGKLALAITVAVVFLGVIGIGVLSTIFSDGWISTLVALDLLGWLVLGIGLLLYLLMTLPEHRTIQTYITKL